MGMRAPGTASCFTRSTGMLKLWITSFELIWTMTSLFTGKWSWLMVTMSSLPSGSSASNPTGLSEDMLASVVLPNFPSLPA